MAASSPPLPPPALLLLCSLASLGEAYELALRPPSLPRARTPLTQLRSDAPRLMAEAKQEGKGLFGRFRKKREVEKAEPITPGMPLPDIEVDALLFVDRSANETNVDIPVAVLPVSAALGNGTSLLVGSKPVHA